MSTENGEMQMAHPPYAQMIDIKRWADCGLYSVVSQSIDRLSEADTAIMLRILDHIHTVDRIFQSHLQGLPHNFKAPRSETMPQFRALAKSTKDVDNWYAAYVANEDDFDRPVEFVFTSGKRARMTRGQ